MEVDRIIYEKSNINIVGATLLSAEEIENLPKHLRKYSSWWWLRSPGNHQDTAAHVLYDGSVYCNGIYVDNPFGCVRPVLQIEYIESSNFQIGDHFTFGGKEFEVISDDLAFCVSDIGRCAFRNNWEADDANDYEKSDIKKFVDDWIRMMLLF